MARSTGFLLLHLGSITHQSLLSKLIASALVKVEKNLYVQVKDLPASGTVSSYNRIVNQIYQRSVRGGDLLDTRVILTDFRDSLLKSGQGLESLTTTHPIDALITLGGAKVNQSLLANKSEDFERIEVPPPEWTSTLDEEAVPQSRAFENVQNLADKDRVYEHVVLGGTFDRLHTGHKLLLSAAILRCEKSLTIGVTDGPMIQTKKLFELIEPCQVRMEKLKEFLMDIEPRLDYKIVPITDPFGPTAYEKDLQLLVVSEETLNGGLKVNQLRGERGLSPLDIHPIVLVDDDQATVDEESKISSSSLRKRLLGSHLRPPKDCCKPFVIGLTGGIASGKTTICSRLQLTGARVISCDHLGHAAYRKGTRCYQQMIEYFGSSILNADQEIDRKKLGPIVFSDKVHLDKLNSMVWPEIRRLYMEEIDSLKKSGFEGVIVLDAAVLLEAGWDQDCHDVWVSIVPPNEAVRRITERDHLPVEQAEKRVRAQLSNSERVSKANVVFCSLWEPHVTKEQVQTAWQYVERYLSQ